MYMYIINTQRYLKTEMKIIEEKKPENKTGVHAINVYIISTFKVHLVILNVTLRQN